MLDIVGFADHIEAHWPGIVRVAIARLLSKLTAIVRENGMALIRHGLEH